MKKIFTLLVFLFTTQWIFAPILPAQNVFQKLLSNTEGNSPNTMKRTADNGFIVTAFTSIFNSAPHRGVGHIIKLDSNMNVVWDSRFRDVNETHFYDVLPLSTGEYLVSGNNQDFSTLDRVGGFLMKLNYRGEQQETKFTGFYPARRMLNIFQKPNGDILTFSGGYVKTNNPAIITRFSNTLSVQKVYGIQKDTLGVIADVACSHPDGAFVTAGHLTNANTHLNRNITIVKFKDNATTPTVDWSKEFALIDASLYALDIKTDPTGNIYVCCSSQFFNQTIFSPKSVVIKLSSTGTIVWTKMINATFNSLSELGLGTILSSATDIILTGSISSIRGDTYLGTIIKLNSSGNVVWGNKIGEDVKYTSSGLLTVIKASDKGYNIVGSSFASWLTGLQKITLLKTDSLGQAGCFTDALNVTTTNLNLTATPVVVTFPNLINSTSILYTNLASSFEGQLTSSSACGLRHVRGKVQYANNCVTARDSPVLKNWWVQAQGLNNQIYSAHTNNAGYYNLEVDEVVTTLSAVPVNNTLWKNCLPFPIVQPVQPDSTITVNLLVNATANCPTMSVDMTGNRLRRCFSDNYLSVNYINNGTATARNARIEVTLDSLLDYVSSTAVLSSRMGQKLIFNLGNVAVFENNSFDINTRVRCGDSTRISQTLCSSAKIFPDSICTLPVNWSGANLTIQGRCDVDSVRFVIANSANVATTPFLPRTVIKNDSIVQLIGTTLPRNGSLTLSFPKNGSTWRVNQTQEPNNPRNISVTAVVEGCRLNGNSAFSYGFVNQFTNATGDPSVSVACLPIVGAFDPNEKFAVPEGVKVQHLIEPNTDIDYQIGFQNTGTDTAFRVVLRDTLSNDLDPATIKMLNASTTKYSWDMVSKNELKITFNNILLPDSFRNEPRSHGFVKFRISQKKDVAIGTRIENKAAIYFDYNAPIFTNKTFHTIGRNFLSTAVDQVLTDNLQVQVTPNPISQQAVFKLPNLMNETVVFELFDVTGKRMRQETHQSPAFIFQRNELQNGFYIFKIKTMASNKSVTGKIVLN